MISKNYPIVYMKVFSCFDYHCVSDLYWKNYIWSFSGCIHLLVHKLWYPDFSPSPIIPMSIWHDKSMVVECLSDTPIYLKILTILIFFFFLFKNRDKREKKEWGFSIKDIGIKEKKKGEVFLSRISYSLLLIAFYFLWVWEPYWVHLFFLRLIILILFFFKKRDWFF